MHLAQAMKKLGNNVKRLRQALGVSQESMRDYGFNYRYFQKLEAGQANVTLDTMVKLSHAFKCKLTDLVE